MRNQRQPLGFATNSGAHRKRGVALLADAVKGRPSAEVTGVPETIANLSVERARELGKAAGEAAFQSAIDAGLDVPIKVGTKIISVVRATK